MHVNINGKRSYVQLNRKKSLKGSRTKDSNITADFTCTLDKNAPAFLYKEGAFL